MEIHLKESHPYNRNASRFHSQSIRSNSWRIDDMCMAMATCETQQTICVLAIPIVRTNCKIDLVIVVLMPFHLAAKQRCVTLHCITHSQYHIFELWIVASIRCIRFCIVPFFFSAPLHLFHSVFVWIFLWLRVWYWTVLFGFCYKALFNNKASRQNNILNKLLATN